MTTSRVQFQPGVARAKFTTCFGSDAKCEVTL